MCAFFFVFLNVFCRFPIFAVHFSRLSHFILFFHTFLLFFGEFFFTALLFCCCSSWLQKFSNLFLFSSVPTYFYPSFVCNCVWVYVARYLMMSCGACCFLSITLSFHSLLFPKAPFQAKTFSTCTYIYKIKIETKKKGKFQKKKQQQQQQKMECVRIKEWRQRE